MITEREIIKGIVTKINSNLKDKKFFVRRIRYEHYRIYEGTNTTKIKVCHELDFECAKIYLKGILYILDNDIEINESKRKIESSNLEYYQFLLKEINSYFNEDIFFITDGFISEVYTMDMYRNRDIIGVFSKDNHTILENFLEGILKGIKTKEVQYVQWT